MDTSMGKEYEKIEIRQREYPVCAVSGRWHMNGETRALEQGWEKRNGKIICGDCAKNLYSLAERAERTSAK